MSKGSLSPAVDEAMRLNLPYLIPRLIRHFLPEKLVRALLLRSIIIRPGLETTDPEAAVQRYVNVLPVPLKGKRILIFGYGGRFDLGFGILKEGAAHIILCDKYAPPDEAHNLAKFSKEKEYFTVEGSRLRPRADRMTLLEVDIRAVQVNANLEPVDIVLSSSVYEHLEDMAGITRALAALTKPEGMQVHFVDLRDHFFKYPFEMLRFSEKTWRMWLNPATNHNRFRLWDYRKAFEDCFENVEIEILASEEQAFRALQPYIRPEFISGNMKEDAAATIRVVVSRPKKV